MMISLHINDFWDVEKGTFDSAKIRNGITHLGDEKRKEIQASIQRFLTKNAHACPTEIANLQDRIREIPTNVLQQEPTTLLSRTYQLLLRLAKRVANIFGRVSSKQLVEGFHEVYLSLERRYKEEKAFARTHDTPRDFLSFPNIASEYRSRIRSSGEDALSYVACLQKTLPEVVHKIDLLEKWCQSGSDTYGQDFTRPQVRRRIFALYQTVAEQSEEAAIRVVESLERQTNKPWFHGEEAHELRAKLCQTISEQGPWAESRVLNNATFSASNEERLSCLLASYL